jgi:integrase/recombinase XerD
MRSFPDDDPKGENCMNRLKVTDQHTVDFLRYHNRCAHQLGRGNSATLIRLLKLLRDRGVIAQRPAQVPATPSERLVEEYDIYLQKERVLSLATRINYRPFVQKFLTVRFGKGPVTLFRLRAIDIIGFVRCHAGQLHGKRVQLMTTALRSFLQFARLRGDITLDLAACLPAVASWSLSTLPRALPPAHVKLVLEHCNRQTAIGRRDYAILLLLARLGLRSGEIAALGLEDIDWKNGVSSVDAKLFLRALDPSAPGEPSHNQFLSRYIPAAPSVRAAEAAQAAFPFRT